MAYAPTNWETGDTITADKLNNIENGIASSGGGGGMLITISQSGDDWVLDKNYTEIKNAIDSGIIPFYLTDGGIPDTNLQEMHTAFGYGDRSGNYFINFCVQLGDPTVFTSDSEEGVLTLIQES